MWEGRQAHVREGRVKGRRKSTQSRGSPISILTKFLKKPFILLFIYVPILFLGYYSRLWYFHDVYFLGFALFLSVFGWLVVFFFFFRYFSSVVVCWIYKKKQECRRKEEDIEGHIERGEGGVKDKKLNIVAWLSKIRGWLMR